MRDIVRANNLTAYEISREITHSGTTTIDFIPMDSLPFQLEALCQESVVPPTYMRNVSPSRKHQKGKRSRKASTVSLRDEGKTKRRTSKHRSSMVETTDHMSNVDRFDEACSLKSNDDDHLSSCEELPSEYEKKSNDAVQHFTLKSDEEYIRQLLEEDELISPKAKKNFDDVVKENPIITAEEEERRLYLTEKFAQNNAFDVIGVMNLSSMNLTDRDIPVIVQRAFGEKKKKCFGLILRDNALTSEGVKILVDSLLKMRINLKYLSFCDNPDIGDEGIVHLTRLLQNNRSMDFLAVPNTGMTDHGVQILAETLCGASTAPLEKLYLSFNKAITDESLDAILQILEQNRTLKLLSLRHCNLSDKARRRLRQVIGKLKKRKFSLAE